MNKNIANNLRNHWLIVHSRQTYEERNDLIGFMSTTYNAKDIRPFDRIVYYFLGETTIKGIYEVTSKPWKKEESWESDHIIEIQPVIELEQPRDFLPLVAKLELFQGKHNWSGVIQGINAVRKISEKDFSIIQDYLIDFWLHEYESIVTTDDDLEVQKVVISNILDGNYCVDDHYSETKIRTRQQIFSKMIKANYKNKCAVCGIASKGFLVASHIVPWSIDHNIRLDPSNGICLCTLCDKAFDKGYITINRRYEIKLSPLIKQDPVLLIYFEKLKGKRVNLPEAENARPKQDYLKYHRNYLFRKI